jgi:putative chitinase
MNDAKLRELLEQFVKDLTALLSTIKEDVPVSTPAINLPTFFNEVRPMFGRLQAKQVSGMESKIKAFKKAGLPLSHAAYAMATSYHETARKMQPVKEGLALSERWRKKNLRYYPWYGRGDVQLTWEENYIKADKKLGLGGSLINDLDLALDPDISAEIMVQGMIEGWFSGDKRGRHTMVRHMPDAVGSFSQFKNSRRIINIMDKAELIAGYAIKFQSALKKAGY